jgi:hypothetical protein
MVKATVPIPKVRAENKAISTAVTATVTAILKYLC